MELWSCGVYLGVSNFTLWHRTTPPNDTAWHAEATLLRRIVFHWRLATPGITRSRRVYEATRVRGVYYSASFRR